MELSDVSQFIRHWSGKALIGPPERRVTGLVFIAVRKNGRKLGSSWFGSGSLWQLLKLELDRW